MNDHDFYEIDANRLDAEWVSQAKRYHHYAEKLAECRRAWEQAKAERDIVAAEKDKEIRSHPGRFGLEKVTEPVVEKTILLSKGYQAANQAVIEAKYALDIVQAAVDTLDHKKKALENLVSLRLSDYYAEPRAPRGAGRAVDDMETDRAFGTRKRGNRD